jgi:hypothetical protein
MTVKELMILLGRSANPSDEVVITREVQAMGSSETGIYGTGEMELHKIESVAFMKADPLGSFDELERLDRVELSIEED